MDAVGLRNILELGSWSQKLRSPGRIGPSSQRFYSWPCPISLSPLRGTEGSNLPPSTGESAMNSVQAVGVVPGPAVCDGPPLPDRG